MPSLYARARQAAVEDRRCRVVEYVRAHPTATLHEIARAVGCSHITVSRDIAAIRKEWAQKRAAEYESYALEDLDRTNALIQALWPHAIAPKGWAVDRVKALMEFRLRLLGLDTQRYEFDVGDVLAKYLERAALGEGDATTS